jgi:hypothetical protein
LIGPTDETAITPGASVGSLKHVALSIVRSFAASAEVRARVVGRRVPEIGALVAQGGDQRHALRTRVLHRQLGRRDDRPLLLLLLRGVRRVGPAVVQPRIDVERHVHDIDAVVGGVRERLEGGPEQEEARVLAGADVDDVDLRRDAADADLVQRGADRAGHVRAVPSSSSFGGSTQLGCSQGRRRFQAPGCPV